MFSQGIGPIHAPDLSFPAKNLYPSIKFPLGNLMVFFGIKKSEKDMSDNFNQKILDREQVMK